jgi:hypothetical protein
MNWHGPRERYGKLIINVPVVYMARDILLTFSDVFRAKCMALVP